MSQTSNTPTHFTLGLLALSLGGAFVLSGCATGAANSVTSPAASGRALSGSVHGGQQPVSGATVTLYAAGKTGTASLARTVAATTTSAAGGFTLPAYTCQTGDQVYLVATGGNSGSGVNTSIAMMAALGSCSTLLANAATSFISVNEVTTAASVAAFAPYMTSITQLGSTADTASTNALAAAFASVATQVNTSTGTPQPTAPAATINSLADSIAACINSAQGSATCNALFTATTVGASVPADTIKALVNLNVYPSQATTATVFALATAASPFQPTLTAAPTTFTLHPSDVLTHHNDNTRQGVQAYETTLTPANVTSANFGKKFTVAVDSYLFAQPLYVGAIGMPDAAVHNVLIAASTHATVYAFDADTGATLWTQSYLPSGERYTVAADYNNCNNPPEAGIVGTPVIDRAAQTIYFVTKTINTSTSVTFQRIHAVSLLDGSERANSPSVIAPVFAGSGAGSTAGSIPFAAQHQVNRAAMTLTTSAAGVKTVWAAFASSCDIGPYHGDILGYDATNVSSTLATFNNTPNGNDGGIWMGAGGLVVDPAGYLYAPAGNGTFTASGGGADYGDSVVKLLPPATGATSTALTVTDYFAPSNEAALENADLDTGGNAGILFKDSGTNTQLLIESDKNGYIYLLNTANMGKFKTGLHGPDSLNGDVQDFKDQNTIIYNFAFFNNTLYSSTPVRAYTFVPGSGTTVGKFNTTAAASTTIGQGAPVISANGATNPIVWVQDTSGILHAYTTGLTELYNTNQAASSRDVAPTFVKFTSPIIANGKVYVSGQGSLAVYGPLP